MQCPACEMMNVVFDSELQAYVCSQCGTVIDDKPIYQGSEGFNKEDFLPRYSGSFTHRVHDHGVGSTEISGSLRFHIKQGRTWVARNIDARMTKEDRKVVKALKELNDLIKHLKPPKAVSETAGEILQKTIKSLNIKEQTLKRVVAASLYLAYKICGYPRPARVYAREIGMSESDLWEGIRKIRDCDNSARLSPESIEPRYYINYIATKLNLSPEVAALANEIVANIKDNFVLSGKSPVSLAAAAVYLAGILTGDRRNQLEVGNVVGQTDVAIRNTYNTLVRALDIEVLI